MPEGPDDPLNDQVDDQVDKLARSKLIFDLLY